MFRIRQRKFNVILFVQLMIHMNVCRYDAEFDQHNSPYCH